MNLASQLPIQELAPSGSVLGGAASLLTPILRGGETGFTRLREKEKEIMEHFSLKKPSFLRTWTAAIKVKKEKKKKKKQTNLYADPD